MSNNKLRWLLAIGKTIIAIIGAAGAVACILVWLKVEPKDVRVMTWPHWLWLVAALILFAISLGSSLRSLYLTMVADKRFSAKIASIDQANAEQIVRINKQHESDEYRSRQARDEIAAELQATKAAQPKPSQYPVPQLRAKIATMVSELQGFLAEHGKEPGVTSLNGESTRDTALRYFKEGNPWSVKFIGDYRLRFRDSIPTLRDEMRARAHIDDLELNNDIEWAANNPDRCCESVNNIAKKLWELGFKVNT